MAELCYAGDFGRKQLAVIMLRVLRLTLLLSLLLGAEVRAHGGVVEEEDLCVIKVNYLRGHFKIYQPLLDGHKEYCEDLPNATESIFVMEYLHDSLASAAVDFRIIHDVTGKGRFARWEDVADINDLDAATVFYREPVVDPDVLTVLHDFAEEGDYIGIVTASINGDEQIYRAVFPFEVGFTGFGYWPLFAALVIALQIQFLFTSSRFRRWREQRRVRKPKLTVVRLLLVGATALGLSNDASPTDVDEWNSARSLYQLGVESSLDPIEINRMHSWVLHVRSDGEPVEGARFVIDGGMPAHDHGLPTQPRVTAELGQGRYRLEGLRFHMHGNWEITIEISAAGKTDTVVVELEL